MKDDKTKKSLEGGKTHHKGAEFGKPRFPRNGRTKRQHKRYMAKNGGSTGSIHVGKI